MQNKVSLIVLCAVLSTTAAAQMPATRPDTGSHLLPDSGRAKVAGAGRAAKIATATRIRTSIALDGKLDDAAWKSATPITDFVQKEPVEGVAPTDRLEVRFVFDDAALYVGTRVITSTRGRTIQAPVSRRDNINQAEHIWISLDSYRDRRTAYSFGVTASGVRGDWYHPIDDETDIDQSFDPVWEAAADLNADGWTAEMRIPFSQIRFNTANAHEWGLNVDHWIPSRNEDVFWIPVPRNATGWSSHMGQLIGIEGIGSARRLELTPYVASDATLTGDRDRANPFDDGRNLGARVGGDLKMGLGPSLTLQATVNPDFGQVEADPSEVNLSAFETFFTEKRPFFTEGSQLLDGAGSYFYSRRIGARPRGGVEGSFVDYPGASTILGAAKLTGRLSSGASVGGLVAVTSREHARIYDDETGDFGRTVVAPLTGYGVGRLQKEFGASASTVGLTLTGVQRDVSSDEPLGALLNRSAYSGGADVNWRIKGGEYAVDALVGFSHITGDSLAILNAQRSSARYFQRPDAKSYHLDPSRTRLSGANGFLGLSKNSGKHWLGSLNGGFESPGFELNDIGSLSTADGLSASAQIRYRETQPGKNLRSYGLSFTQENAWNFDHNREFSAIRTDANATFQNFWTLNFTGWHDFRGQNERLTRGGPLMATGYSNVGIIALTNSIAANTRWQARVYYGKDEFGALTNRISGLLSFRPGPRWQLSLQPNYLIAQNAQQYVTTLGGGREETYDRRYVFAYIDRSTFFTDIRLNYTFKPDISFELYAQPFAASGRYSDFGELSAPRRRLLRKYGQDGTTIEQQSDNSYLVTDSRVTDIDGNPSQFTLPFRDFNVRSIRSNMVLRWEYRPGSTLFFVWQQDREGGRAFGDRVRVSDLFDGFSEVGTNFFAIKATFWIPAL
ncbi:MAG: carbohydrate binding family 9 domain-containing protein [Anaerolineae bacterium]|nr:carbohydrate binding family 9 domain-containing protein [Gemmatimonadaceae bacterium]